ncbi:MAG: CBS domain-containing protein [Deltaproteobacteria bacterium]|nr:CBS domain-containing protein [Deltaproteobacteria bacterium]
MPVDLSQFTVERTDSIRTAMERITANRHRVVVVLDAGTVVGTVSDGDLRRAFLKDVLPIAPVDKIMNVNCFTTRERDRARLREIIAREKLTVLPVVDEKNRLLDIAVAYEPYGEEEDPHGP